MFRKRGKGTAVHGAQHGTAPPQQQHQPALLSTQTISVGSNCTKIWDDTNTAAKPYRLAIFRPHAPHGYHILGDVAERSHDRHPNSSMTTVVVAEPRNHSGPSLLAPPRDFVKVWEDKGTHGKFGDCAIWQPIPPPGYVACGYVATNSYHKPNPNVIRCVHVSAAGPAKAVPEADGKFIWCDRHSGAKFGDVSFWHLAPVTPGAVHSANTWIAVPNHSHPASGVFNLPLAGNSMPTQQPHHQPQHQPQSHHQPQHQPHHQPQHQPHHQPQHQSHHQPQHQSHHQPQHQSHHQQGFAPQGYPQQQGGFAPQGYPQQQGGFAPQGYPQQQGGFAQQGFPQQGGFPPQQQLGNVPPPSTTAQPHGAPPSTTSGHHHHHHHHHGH